MTFADKLALLQQLVNNTLAYEHALYGVEALPQPEERPGIYLLGGSANSTELAAEQGVHFVFARFLNSDDHILEEAVQTYRNLNPDGKIIVAVAALAAPAQEEAEALAGSDKVYRIHLESGKSLTVQSLEQVSSFAKQTDETFEIEEKEGDVIAGTPAFVRQELDRLPQDYGIDEFIIHTSLRKEVERIRSFELLSPFRDEKTVNKRERGAANV